MTRLRVVDAGAASALRSQALWHGIAEAMEPGDPPVLSFCVPSEPYVSIGYHRRLDELDHGACRDLGLRVVRRRIGGGPVYLDCDQLLFQITMPARRAPAAVDRLYAELLGPAVAAFRALGADARLDGLNDIAAGERRLSGTGAGRIGDAVVVVGNVNFRFPHARMARVLALPGEDMRSECLRLMRRHVGSLRGEGIAAGPAEARAALRDAYARAVAVRAVEDGLSDAESAAVAGWERRMATEEWTAGPVVPRPSARQVKVRDGVWVVDGDAGGLRVRATFSGGRVASAHVGGGTGGRLAQALVGAAADGAALRQALAPFGSDGERVVRALEPGLVVR